MSRSRAGMAVKLLLVAPAVLLVLLLAATSSAVAVASSRAAPSSIIAAPARMVSPTSITAVPSSIGFPTSITAAPSPTAADGSSRAPAWSWPVATPRVTRAFAAPPTPYASGHRGLDLEAAAGAAVLSPASATVRFAGVVVDRPVLTLDHGDGVLSSYEPVTTALAPGDPVIRGQSIATVATGGHCSASCLHVGVRIDGVYVSPLLFFDRVPPSVLLPLGAPGR